MKNLIIAAIDTTSSGLIHLGVYLAVLAIVCLIIWHILIWMELSPFAMKIARVICGLIVILIVLHLIGLY